MPVGPEDWEVIATLACGEEYSTTPRSTAQDNATPDSIDVDCGASCHVVGTWSLVRTALAAIPWPRSLSSTTIALCDLVLKLKPDPMHQLHLPHNSYGTTVRVRELG